MTSEHIRPSYAEAYRCIGSECEDHCCRDWAVLIDKATYQKYESLPDIQPFLNEYFSLKAIPSDEAFAYVRFSSSGNCPLFTEDRLCGIQQKHGADYLSRTCAVYPRTVNNVGGQKETTVTLSCPEAARLVLLHPQLVPELDASSTHARYGRFLLKKPVAVRDDNPTQFFWQLRGFVLALLKDPRYPLWQRLFLMGSFCGRLGTLLAEKQIALIPKLLNDYSEIIIEKRLRAAMDGISVQPVPQLEVAVKCAKRAAINMNSRRFSECIQDFLQGIQHVPDKPLEDCVPAYTEASARYYRPFMDAHPSILENYLVDHVFGHCFPLTRNNGLFALTDPQTAYFMMCIHFAVIQTMLIGIAGHYREQFGTEHVIKLFSSFTRTGDHNAKFLDEVQTYLGEANLINPNGMAILLKTPAD